MAEFTPIKTQAEFDAAIAERLSRQEKSLAAKYEGMMPAAEVAALKQGYEKTIQDLTEKLQKAGETADGSAKQIGDLQAKVRAYETDSAKTRIALELGLPWQMAGRLSGNTEEEIRKDAEALRGFMSSGKPVAPLANPSDGGAGAPRDQFANWFGEALGR